MIRFKKIVLVCLSSLIILSGILSHAKLGQAAPLAGQLIVDPTTNRWLVYNRDNNGDGQKDPFFMCGPGDPEGLLYQSNAASSISSLINNTGANSLYVMGIRSFGDGGSNEDPFNIHRDTHSGINQSIINGWKTLLQPADNAGIATHFFFYDDATGVGGEMGWPLQNGQLHPEEKAYIDAVVNSMESFKHIIWVVMEETQEMGGDHLEHARKIAEEIRLADDYDHPIGVHQLSGLNFLWADDPNVDQFTIQYNVGTADQLHSGMVTAWNNANGRYNLNMSESANHGTGATARQKNWAVATGGAYIMVLGWSNFSGLQTDLKQCGYLVDFFESTDFNTMAPHDDLKLGGTTYVLANPGISYIGYSPNLSGNMGFKSLISGSSYTLKWFDTVTGTSVNETKTATSTEQSWPKPSGIGSEVALYIKKSGTSPSGSPTPSGMPTPTPTQVPNQAPVALNSSVSTAINTPVYVQLAITDDGIAPGGYTYTITQNSAHGILSGTDNDRTYTPTSGFSGTDTFKWKVNDGQYDSNTATVTINVGNIQGDANSDGSINLIDFAVWRLHNGQNLSGAINGDFNNSGQVDVADFTVWIGNYAE